MRDVLVTTSLVFLATAFERADESILPACFKSIEADRGWSPSMLSQLVFARTMAQALASPLFGLAADFGAGRRGAMMAMMGAGVLGWSAVTLALAEGAAGYRATLGGFALLGVALTSVIPPAASVLAELHPSSRCPGRRARALSAPF